MSGRRVYECGYLWLRITWTNWLASLLLLYAWPALTMQLPWVSDSVVIATGAGGVCARADCEPEPWLIMEWEPWWHNASLCFALVLATLLPTTLHRRHCRKLYSAFAGERSAPRATEVAPSRTPPASTAVNDTTRRRAYVRAFNWRLIGGMSFGAVAFLSLWEPQFVKNYGCVYNPSTFCVTEYLAYVIALSVAALVHMPMKRRVFGYEKEPPHAEEWVSQSVSGELPRQ